MSKKTTLIIDGNHMLHRGYHKFARMKAKDGTPTGAIYGVTAMMSSLMKEFKPSQVFFVVDSQRSEFRLDLLPGYKDRKPRLGFDLEDFCYQREEIIKLMDNLGVYVVRGNQAEGDDWWYKIYRKVKSYCILVSGDKDANQLISEDFHLWVPKDKVLLTPENFYEHRGYEPHQTVDYLTLLGDSSDNIPGYRGIGEQRALKFLEEHSSIKSFLSSNSTHKNIKKDKLEDLYSLNRKLIDLKYYYRKFLRKIKLPILNPQTKYNYKAAWEFAVKYNITSFIPNIKRFK